MIRIYRFGRYIASVESESALYEWIVANVPYEKNEMLIPEGCSLEKCKSIAKERNYTFLENATIEISAAEVARLTQILNVARFPEVAEDLSPISKRGLNYFGICPHCHDRALIISPSHQIYKCYRCGRTGNLINYVMAERHLTYEDALNYLESKYSNK